MLRRHENTAADKNRTLLGLALLVIGALLFAENVVDGLPLEMFVMPLIGACFLVAARRTRQAGLLIPGGILLGIGLGFALVAGPFEGVAGEMTAGIQLLSMAAGWALITPLSMLWTDERATWPLIPAVILSIVGTTLMIGRPLLPMLEASMIFWPLALVITGAMILFRRPQR